MNALTRIFAAPYAQAMNPQLLAALGEPNRFRIVELLRDGPQPVSHIVERLGLRQSQVSQHLKVLKEVGLVGAKPHAQQRLYGLQGEPLKQTHVWLGHYRRHWEEQFQQLDALVAELKQEKTPKAASET
jgi:DNA-binding transcriptional ArsR family regulator